MLDKQFDPKEIEPGFIKEWEESGLTIADPESRKSPFTIMMPPPNVTGSLHIGHALNHTLQDILARYKRMKGFDVLWQPGTDHASIAVHMVLEKQLAEEGKTRQDLGRERFLKKAWEWKEYSGNTITSQLRRLGTTPDWSRERFTMDDGLSDAVLKAFVDLYKDGLIYRAERLVNWDPVRQTVISDLEVNQRENKGHMWHIDYPIEGEQAKTIRIATTRPETMFGDTAIAVHPDDGRYKDLVGKFAILPIAGRPIPIIADEYSDPEKGSGAVKITPAHDFNDFEVGQRHGLPMISVMDETAHMNDNVPEEYQGLDRYEARKKILAELESRDLLAEIEDVVNSIPYGERSGAVIEPFLTKQWFCDTPALARDAASAVRDGRTDFVPKQYENMYFAWVDNQLPWCISRQLWWGHQVPAWYDEDGNVYVAQTEEEAQAEAGQGAELTRETDVLDTWFSSALWPFSTIGWPEHTPELEKYFKTDVLITGFDIITFWVSRMMMFSLYFMKDVPFKDIYIHALVRDAKGQKMSKSKGNVIDPLDLINQYGADSVRFTLTAMAAQGRDIRLSEDRVEGYRNFGTKLWNAARYCEMNECKFDDAFDPRAVTGRVNQWIIHALSETVEELDKSLEDYKFNESANILYHFVWGGFCDWFLEFTKPILSLENPDDQGLVHETKQTTAWVLNQILVMLNPFMPFITEELNRKYIGSKDLLLGAKWLDGLGTLKYDGASEELEWVKRLISEIRSVRSDMNVPAGAKIQLLVKGASDEIKEILDTYRDIICRLARLVDIGFHEGTVPSGSIQTVLDDITLILPVADIIDLDQERARLQKEIDKIAKDIEKIEQKLSNKKFLANAPEEVVQEQKTRKSDAETMLDKLSNALKQLQVA